MLKLNISSHIIGKKFSTTLHTQFIYLTQPITPFTALGFKVFWQFFKYFKTNLSNLVVILILDQSNLFWFWFLFLQGLKIWFWKKDASPPTRAPAPALFKAGLFVKNRVLGLLPFPYIKQIIYYLYNHNFLLI